MADLISREAALAILYECGGDEITPPNMIEMRGRMYKLPAVDAVEVVRCRECEDYEDGECVCPYIWTSDGAHIWPEADHFCSYGKKRGENND